MDVTTIQLGGNTRDALRDYKDERDFQNYDEAIRSLLQRVES